MGYRPNAVQLPITGHPLHTRSLTLVGKHLEDGRVAARGVVNDLRKCGFVPLMHGLQPAGIIHQMSIDLVVDPAEARIDSLVTDQPFVAVEPTPWTKGECCRDPASHLDVLVGERIDREFPKKLSAAFGGPRGCSHLLTLFQMMSAAIPRALAREAGLGGERRPGEKLFWRSCFLDGYETETGRFELAVQFHDFHSRPQGGLRHPLERFHRHDEVRVFARVDTKSLAFETLRAAERVRTEDDLANDTWLDHTERVAPLTAGPIIPGLAGRVFGHLGDAAETEVLRDALLQLAPGHIQVMAATMDRWFVGAGEGEESFEHGSSMSGVGGMADSCWMWRSDGALGKSRIDLENASAEDDPTGSG